jgi:hypothetical protein
MVGFCLICWAFWFALFFFVALCCAVLCYVVWCIVVKFHFSFVCPLDFFLVFVSLSADVADGL